MDITKARRRRPATTKKFSEADVERFFEDGDAASQSAVEIDPLPEEELLASDHEERNWKEVAVRRARYRRVVEIVVCSLALVALAGIGKAELVPGPPQERMMVMTRTLRSQAMQPAPAPAPALRVVREGDIPPPPPLESLPKTPAADLVAAAPSDAVTLTAADAVPSPEPAAVADANADAGLREAPTPSPAVAAKRPAPRPAEDDEEYFKVPPLDLSVPAGAVVYAPYEPTSDSK